MISAFIAFTVLACGIDPPHEVLAQIEWRADAGLPELRLSPAGEVYTLPSAEEDADQQ